ncbi:DinB family protein [Fulvivirgaceae bacterium BMA12]|uniref:DinB family protein n=1 Tax=Agaribacillus aureus TaxID=3051825 RepID=A0ABT8KYS4_9BACT|nr:DinB family protein [Fulvivirgaceae bacterium BMA12]
MKTLFNCACLLSLALVLSYCAAPTKKSDTQEAEESVPTYKIVEGHAPVWTEVISQMMELADAMPEDQYNYKPHDSVRSFAEQLVHIGGASKVISNMFLKDVKPDGPPPAVDVSGMSKDDIKNMVKTSLEETWEIMKGMSDQQLLDEETQSFSGNKMSRLEGMLLVHDHLSNHKAKLNLYVRLSGNEPPRYRYY